MDDADITGWIDGDLDSADHARFQERLRDPALAREFLRALHFEAALRVTAQARTEWQRISSPADGPVSTHPGRAPSSITSRNLRFQVLAAAAVLALITLAWVAAAVVGQPRPVVARLVADAGMVKVDGRVLMVGGSRNLAAGESVVLAADATATLGYADGTLVSLGASSQLTLGGEDAEELGKCLRLSSGELSAEVAPQPPAQPLRIITPRCAITVLGTRLAVASGATEQVQVDHGRIRVVRLADRSAAELIAGEQVDVTASGALAVTSTAPGPSDEPPPVSGLLLWLDADRGVETDSLGRISQWRDRSGQHLDLTQSSTAAQPRRLDRVVAGHAAVSFDARDDHLLCQAPWPEFDSYTVAVALRATSFGQWSQTFGSGWGSFLFHGDERGGLYAGVGDVAGARFTPADLPSVRLSRNTWHWCVITYEQRSGRGDCAIDGTLVGSKPMPHPRPWHSFRVGCQTQEKSGFMGGFAGDVQEILVYDRVLTPDERGTLDRHFRVRLGLTP